MSMLMGAIIVVVAILSFLGGFIMGCNFTKSYLKANGLLLDEPKPAAAKGCGKGDCDCGS
jgi:hypothetical protein